MKKGISVVVLLFLAGCSQKHIQRKSKKTVAGLNAQLHSTYHTQVAWDQQFIHPDEPLSLERAITMAMQNNAQLQADLEMLGIANADLMQAQLFSNPELATAFEIPKQSSRSEDTRLKTDVDIELAWKLSDLWQVPLRKRVAEDELEIISLRVLQNILDIYAETKIVYSDIVYQKALYVNAQAAYAQAKELNKQIKYRYNFGYNTEQEIYLSNADVKKAKIELTQAQRRLDEAYVRIRELLYLPISTDPIALTQDLFIPAQLPSQKQVGQLMLKNRPEIHIAQMHIEQATHKIKLERAKVFDDVQIGLSYARKPDGRIRRGPLFGLSLPVFDLNQAQISRAKTVREKRKKELISTKHMLLKKVLLIYQEVETKIKNIARRKQILDTYQKAIDFDLSYAQNMQISWIHAMQNQLAYYEQRKLLLTLLMETSKNLAELERSIGTSLNIKFNLKKLPIDKLI